MSIPTDHNTPVDPRNPAKKYYSGGASLGFALLSFFVATGLFATIGLACGIVAIVTGGKIDNQKLKGEGWIGTVLCGIILAGYIFISSSV